MTRVMITGGRGYSNRARVYQILDAAVVREGIDRVVDLMPDQCHRIFPGEGQELGTPNSSTGTDSMQITQDHIDFVASCIEKGEPEGKDCVRVDVLAIGERFGVTWAVARNILQAATHALGHRMAGPRSSVVRKVPAAPVAPPKSRAEILRQAASDLMAGYEAEKARKTAAP